MTDLVEAIRAKLFMWGELTEVLLNTLSLIVIVFGVIYSLYRSVQERQRTGIYRPRHTYFRRIFGGWLVMALEFQLAADIVGTIISPSYEELIKLGAVAVIRTFLNYFLSKELNEESETIRTAIENVKK